MQEPSQRPWSLFLVIILTASVIGGGLAWVLGVFGPPKSSQNPISQTTESPVATSIPEQSPTPSATQVATPKASPSGAESTSRKAQVYWLQGNSAKTELIARSLKPQSATPTEAQSLEAALNQLLSGANDASLATTIPKGTTLLSLTLKSDGIHIDLSKAFISGGGVESMKGRLGQILYTATSLNPDTPVWLSIEGKPLEVLGGEGLVVDQPLTRKLFEKEYM